MLWSLGLDDSDLILPHAVVLYGKARWIEPLLAGDEITVDTLLRILSVIGADCECGLDTRLLRGTMLPIYWGSESRARATRSLGFDPENPIIVSEVSQILRMRALLWPEISASRQTASDLDDLPVPFVDDIEANERQAYVLLGPVAYFAGAAALLVIGVGIVMFAIIRRGS